MDNNEFDKLIKESLSNAANKITPRDSFNYIQSSLNKGKRVNSRWSFILNGYGFNLKRVVTVFACGILMILSLSLIISDDARAAAVDTISKLKTIFVVDNVDGIYKVVKENADEAKVPFFAVSASTTFSETEINKMLGYKIHFPESLGEYKLVDRGMGLLLENKITYETALNLQESMTTAIIDENDIKKLKDFKPLRDVSGAYKNGKETFFIEINNGKTWQTDLMAKSNNIKDVMIGNLKGKWVELPIPIYPIKQINGTGEFDISQKPTEIKIIHALLWKSENINYMITTNDRNSEPTLDNMINIAQCFISNMNSLKDFKSTIVYEVMANTISDKSMDNLINILKSRFEAMGFKDVQVIREGDKKIKLFVTGDQELDSLAAIEGNCNQLKFVSPDGTIDLTEKDIKGASVSNGALLIQFTNAGKDKLYKATSELINKPLSVFLDNKLLISPIVRSPISDGRVILTGMDNIEEIKRLAAILKSGNSLEYPLKVVTIEVGK